MVKTSPSQAGNASLIPDQGAGIPHASQPDIQNIKQKQYCNRFSKDLTNNHIKKKILKKQQAKLYIRFAAVNSRHCFISFSSLYAFISPTQSPPKTPTLFNSRIIISRHFFILKLERFLKL